MESGVSEDGAVDVRDLFSMTVREFCDVWGLTLAEIKSEGASGRLGLSGRRISEYEWTDMQATYPALRKWLARKWKMPAKIRAKVEDAGGMARLDQFVRDQWNACTFDLGENTMTLPNGEVLHDLRFNRDDVLALWPVKH